MNESLEDRREIPASDPTDAETVLHSQDVSLETLPLDPDQTQSLSRLHAASKEWRQRRLPPNT